MGWKKKVLAGLAAAGVVAVAVGWYTSANAVQLPEPVMAAAVIAPANSCGSSCVINGSLWASDLNPNVVKWFTQRETGITETQLSSAVKAKLNAVGTGGVGPAGPAGPKGDTGPAGPAGKDAVVSVTALTSLTNRPDSGMNGDWAKDNLTRSVAITRQAAVEASKCGASATTCWFYTGSLIDNGTFATIDGAKSPQAGTAVNGIVQGTVTGGTKLEFYASSDTPDPQLVQGSVDGGAYPTSEWAKQFFPAGVSVTPATLLDWSWSYNASATCETWVNALVGNKGDVVGVNACPK